MALNIITDPQFDKNLAWLARKEEKTKSDVIRDLVFEKVKEKKPHSFQRGALRHLFKGKRPTTEEIVKELKEMDEDHDLDGF